MADNSMVVQLGLDLQKYQEGLNKSTQMLNGFKDQITNVGKGLLAAFAVERVAEFGFEVSKLAGQAEGVKHAFDRLADSQKVLEGMRMATQNTVSDLALMKYAVQAENFGIPIKNLGNLFEFAHQRAAATGQSVDYLVQSIVTGIGRKSPLILDNLGISAVALKEKLKGVGTETATVGDVAQAVGDIADEALKKMGGAIETTSTKIEQNQASWENLKVKIGSVLNESGLLAKSLSLLTTLLDHMASDDKPLTKLQEASVGLRGAMVVYNADQKKGLDLLFAATLAAEKMGFAVKEVRDENNKLIDIYAVEKEKIGENSDATNKKAEIIKNIAFYEKEIADLKAHEKEVIGDELSNTQKQIELEQEKLNLLQQQFALQRDAEQSAQIGKMSNKDVSVKGLGTFGLPVPPSEEMDKVAQSVDKAKASLDRLASAAPQYTNAWHSIFDEQKIQQFVQILHAGMVNIVTDLAAGLGELATGAAGSEQIFATLLSTVGSMAIQLGQLAIGTAIAIAAIDEALTSLNPVVALAAGIALVALGAAVKGAAAGIAKSGGGGGNSIARQSFSSGENSSYRSNAPLPISGMIKIQGQDLWVVLSNYQTNSKFTKIG